MKIGYGLISIKSGLVDFLKRHGLVGVLQARFLQYMD